MRGGGGAGIRARQPLQDHIAPEAASRGTAGGQRAAPSCVAEQRRRTDRPTKEEQKTKTTARGAFYFPLGPRSPSHTDHSRPITILRCEKPGDATRPAPSMTL